MSRFRRSFAERNKIAVAFLGTAALVAAFLVAFNAESLPIIGGGTVYTADFAESGGLRSGNDVRIAGVKVGQVTEVSLHRKTVVVKFRVKGTGLGDESTAAVKVKTMLGQKYLSVDPVGDRPLRGAIPVQRTTTPYDVNAAFSDLADDVGKINTRQVEESLDVLSAAFKDTPASVRRTLSGLTALSKTISSRDDQLAGLFKNTSTVTRTLASRDSEFAKLINDGGALLDELQQRRAAVTALLKGTAQLGESVRGIVADNEQQLRPALAKLDRVTAILNDNQSHLELALKRLGPYYRILTSAMGNGRWVDSYICGLFDNQDRAVLDNDVVRNCHPVKGGGR
jgi:phospholipid/cholesterol/gamma-HCH transport system substrate-binding protein